MKRNSERAAGCARALLWLGLPLAAAPALGAEVWLCAKAGSISLPGSPALPIWGYVADDDANLANGCPGDAALPGPPLVVPAGDATLTVHLRNDLPQPTSLVIPGQRAAMTPVWDDGSSGPRTAPGQRVRSFTHEAAPGGGSADYSWSDLKPGTYLYHSGTRPQVQVQMGLYGALAKKFAAGPDQAYDGASYDAELTLVFSAIDPLQNNAIAAGTFNTAGAPATACLDTDGSPMPLTSTQCYRPQHFLINGKPYAAGNPPLGPIPAGQRTLLRLLNAGLQSYAPVIQGMHMKMIAEDGNAYPWGGNPRQQYSTLLPALKTVDAIVTPPAPGTFPLYDRRLNLANGGMLVQIEAAGTPGNTAPVITTTSPLPDATEGLPYAATITATDPGDTLTFALEQGPVGMTIGAASGEIQWTPTAAQVGSQSLRVRVSDSGGLSDTETFAVTVLNVNSAPVANNDRYDLAQRPSTGAYSGLTVAAPGVLGNDTDPDPGDSLTAGSFGPVTPAGGTLAANPNGSFSFTPPVGFSGQKTFTYQARDAGGLASNTATVTLNVIANRPPVAVDDTFSAPVRRGGSYPFRVLNELANDSDLDTVLDPNNRINPLSGPIAAQIVTPPSNGGTASIINSGANRSQISYRPAVGFRGTETLSYRVRDTRGAWSAPATVRVNVQ